MKRLTLIGLLISATAAIVSGCAYSSSGQSYPRDQTRTAYEVEYGEIVSTRTVEIEGHDSLIGTLGGAGVGHAIGSTGGDWDSRWLAGVVGGLVGTLAGQAIERRITEEEGLEITVRLDRSYTIAVVQAQDVLFTPGERVTVLFGPDGSTRVNQL
jgi:outer membrane lipoprotein SlyB